MLSDILGISEELLKEFALNPEGSLRKGKFYKHRTDSSTEVSIIFDKYITELVSEYVKLQNPKWSIYSGKGFSSLLAPHFDKKYVLKLDINKYFRSIKYEMVRETFSNLLPNDSLHEVVQQFYFGDNVGLKEGLKASPAISEIVGLKIDHLIQKLIHTSFKRYTLGYSRFYDDIMVSSDSDKVLRKVFENVKSMLKDELELEVSIRKSKLIPVHGSNLFGIRIHNGTPVAPKRFRNKLRAAIHNFEANQQELSHEQKEKLLQSIVSSLKLIVGLPGQDTNEKYLKLLSKYQDKLSEIT